MLVRFLLSFKIISRRYSWSNQKQYFSLLLWTSFFFRCMLLDPPMIPTNPNATILTNSGKYAHYGKLLMFWTRLESGSFFKRTQFILIVIFFSSQHNSHRPWLNRSKISTWKYERLCNRCMDWLLAETIIHEVCSLEDDGIAIVFFCDSKYSKTWQKWLETFDAKPSRNYQACL